MFLDPRGCRVDILISWGRNKNVCISFFFPPRGDMIACKENFQIIQCFSFRESAVVCIGCSADINPPSPPVVGFLYCNQNGGR